MELKLSNINTKYQDGQIQSVVVGFSNYESLEQFDVNVQLKEEDSDINNMTPIQYEKVALEKVQNWIAQALDGTETSSAE